MSATLMHGIITHMRFQIKSILLFMMHQIIFYMVKIFFVSFCFLVTLAVSSDTLKQGDVLNSSSFLVSASNIFTLGFFSPGDLGDSYLGIWYTNDTASKTVWVANRDTPIYNNSGVLSFDEKGKLVITHNSGQPIELYSGQISSPLAATILNSGNFVVRLANLSILWRSFDYPTDTLLPTMKLGVNHKTGQQWSLISWLAKDVPAPGPFTLEWDTKERKLVVKRRGVVYWTSGSLHSQSFEHIFPANDPTNFNYFYTNVTNEYEDYFSYSLLNDPVLTPEDHKIISGWLLDYQGQISDHDRTMIARVDLCYGYNTNGSLFYGGCALWKQPKCRNSHDKFDLKSGLFGLIDEGDVFDNNSRSLSDCRETCWKDCDCVGFKNDGDTKCQLWRGKDLKFTEDVSGVWDPRYVLSSDSGPVSTTRKKRNRVMTVVIVMIAVGLGLALLGLLYYRRRIIKVLAGRAASKNEKDVLEVMKVKGYMEDKEFASDDNKGPELAVFTHASIAAATNNFSSKNKLGEGGFGPVYKGILPGGREIAVKQLSTRSNQGVTEFKNELILIAKLQHTNLVRLLGCCIHEDDKMLIYEYMPNKSLDFFLFNENRREQLSWEIRFSIIEGIAQGLLYLHKYSRLRIIHRDLKAGNILLDASMNPKISDFGMARICKQDVTEANTVRIVGTFGYMAPEYAMEGIFSVKSDVFSFGVLLLEIVSARKSNSFYDVEGPVNLVGYAWELWNKNAALELVDPTLNSSCCTGQLLRCITVALLCVEDCSSDRPTMSEVVAMLTNESMALRMPKKPAFVSGAREVEDDSKRINLGKYSVNELSITDMDGR